MSAKEIKEIRQFMRDKMKEICDDSDDDSKDVETKGVSSETAKKLAVHQKQQVPMNGHLSRYFI